jgi:DNA-directed RNA polymerase subunit K/omega
MSDTPRAITRPKNSFEFVTVASARARQLLQGCLPKVDGSPKPARRALQEVAAGLVWRTAPEQGPDAGATAE